MFLFSNVDFDDHTSGLDTFWFILPFFSIIENVSTQTVRQDKDRD